MANVHHGSVYTTLRIQAELQTAAEVAGQVSDERIALSIRIRYKSASLALELQVNQEPL